MAERNLKGDVNVEFNEASSRQGLDSGESVKTLFGKLRKWLSDLKPVAFSGSYNDLSNKPTIPDISGKADKSTTVSTVTYDTTNKKLTKTINNVTSDIASLSRFKEDMELNNIVTIPTIRYGQLPSQSTSLETYFKEWIAYCVENYREIMLSQKTIVGVCVPNARGSIIGQCYNAGVDSTTGLPRYCNFVYIHSTTGTAYTFGTNDYVFFLKYLDTWRGVQNNLTSSSTSESLAAAQGKVLKELADTIQAQANYNTLTGVKNQLITDSKSGTATIYGITITSNNDGTFTINGTNSNSGSTMFAPNLSDLSLLGSTTQITPKTLKSNKIRFYVIGLPSTVQVQLAKSTSVSVAGITLNAVQGSAVSDVVDITNYDYVWFRLVADANASFNNVVIKPMVVDASVEDTGDFVPHAMSNVDLTQKALIKEDDNAGGYVVYFDKDCKLQRNGNYIYLRNNSINIHADSSNISLQCGTTGSPLRGVSITNTAVRMYFGLNTLTVDEDGLWFNGTKIAE